MSLIRGILSPFAGAGMILKNRSMSVLTLIPFILNIILLFVMFFYAYGNVSDYIMSLLPQGGQGSSFWYTILHGFIETGLGVLIFLIISLIYLSTAAIIAGPFNSILSEMTEKKITGKEKTEQSFRIKDFFVDLIRIFTQEIRKIFLLILIFVISFMVNLIPGIGPVFFVMISYLALTFFTGMEYLDFPMEARKWPFSEKLKFAKSKPLLTIGIGITVTLLFYIPFVFSFAAVGATKVFLHYHQD